MVFRVDCCADEFLKTVLTTRHLFTLDDASWQHLVACPACKHRLIRIWESQRDSREEEFPSIEGGVVLRKIGSGGGGCVWLFLNQADGLAFEAIKVAREQNAEDGQTRMENASLVFDAERERLARLDDGNSVVSYKRNGLTKGDQRPYIAMTFLRGSSPTLFARRFDLSLHQRVRLARDISRAIESIHRSGVIHCDLKPGNIIVTLDRTWSPSLDRSLAWKVRIVDFGCSHDRHEIIDGKLVEQYLSHVAGTPGYICPELLGARDGANELMPVRATIDVFALGIILFELVTGRLPWSCDDDQQEKFCHEHTRRKVPEDRRSTDTHAAGETLEGAKKENNQFVPSDANEISYPASSLGEALEHIVTTAAATDAQERYQSAAELADQLDSWLRHHPDEGDFEKWPVFVRRWTTGNQAMMAIVSAVLLLMVGLSILVVASVTDAAVR
jgi:serine/threonine-protein kinase